MIFFMECLRRLGFEGDQMTACILTIGNATPPGRYYCVKLNAQDKEFVAVMGAPIPGLSDQEFSAEFEAAVHVWNAQKGAESNTWDFFNSDILKNHDVELVAGLIAKGFKLPCAMA